MFLFKYFMPKKEFFGGGGWGNVKFLFNFCLSWLRQSVRIPILNTIQ